MMTRNRSIDRLRRNRVRGEDQWVQLSNIEIAADPENLETEVEQRFQRDRLRTALAALPAEHAQALSLAYFNGMSHQQIATYLGKPLGTIKTRIRLALKKLRESLEGEKEFQEI